MISLQHTNHITRAVMQGQSPYWIILSEGRRNALKNVKSPNQIQSLFRIRQATSKSPMTLGGPKIQTTILRLSELYTIRKKMKNSRSNWLMPSELKLMITCLDKLLLLILEIIKLYRKAKIQYTETWRLLELHRTKCLNKYWAGTQHFDPQKLALWQLSQLNPLLAHRLIIKRIYSTRDYQMNKLFSFSQRREYLFLLKLS